jgi:D-3-phosphoglycerate dehydrogenase / 2-oxoglutarate reductase
MKILANDGISPSGQKALQAMGHELLEAKVAQEQLADFINKNQVDVLLVRSATKVRQPLIDSCPGLKIIGRGGVGMDNIDVSYAREKGLHVINTPAASSQSVAELVMAHLSGMVRFLHQSNRQMPLEGDSHFSALKKAYGGGIELAGKTIGIVGFGRIGKALANIAFGWGMHVIAHDRGEGDFKVTKRFPNGQELIFEVKNHNLDELYAQADFISFHVSGAGLCLADAASFGKMKKGVFLVNTSRGGVIDEEALLEALESGHVAGAALDVFVNEPTPSLKVLMNNGLSLTPHIGAATDEAQDRIGEELAELIDELSKELAQA